MNFKPNPLSTTILPTYINTIEGIIFYKNQKTKQKIKDYIFIKKVSRDIIEILEKTSIQNVGYKSTYVKIKKYGKITLELIRIQRIKKEIIYYIIKCNKLLYISKKYSKFVKRRLQFPDRPAK